MAMSGLMFVCSSACFVDRLITQLTGCMDVYCLLDLQVHRWYRATVEHSIVYIKRFHILSGVYRGRFQDDASEISNAIKIIIHASAYYIRSPPRRNHPVVFPVSISTLYQITAVLIHRLAMMMMMTTQPVNPTLLLMALNNWDPAQGTALTHANLNRGQIVDVWLTNDWWRATITWIYPLTNRVNVKVFGSDVIMRNIMPKHTRYPRA